MKNIDPNAKKFGNEPVNQGKSSLHQEAGIDNFDLNITRRALMRMMALAGIGFAIPWQDDALAQTRFTRNAPSIPFKRNETGDGIVGPYGEVRVFDVGGDMLPVFVKATNDLAVMDVTGRSAFVRYGKGATSITLTAEGVKFGETAKAQPWSGEVVRKLISALTKDRDKLRGAMLLRSALHTSYPVAVAQSKKKTSKRMGTAMGKSALDYGWRALYCTTTTVTETVEECVTKLIEDIKTAEEQYQECYDKEVKKDPCKSVPFGAKGPCAAAICAAKTFIDIVEGFIEVITCIVKTVVREVVNCTAPKQGEWPNPWDQFDLKLGGFLPQPQASFSKKNIDEGLKLLDDFGGFLGPFGKCFIRGEWSLAQLDTKLKLDGTNVVIPYGIKVCISDECGSQLSDPDMFADALVAWGTALSLLAALSPEFAAAVAGLGIVPLASAAAAIAALPQAAVAAAAIILAFILLALLYATAISAQLYFHRNHTNNFADGKVCIEHPTFAIALISMATLGYAHAELIPPIVTG